MGHPLYWYIIDKDLHLNNVFRVLAFDLRYWLFTQPYVTSKQITIKTTYRSADYWSHGSPQTPYLRRFLLSIVQQMGSGSALQRPRSTAQRFRCCQTQPATKFAWWQAIGCWARGQIIHKPSLTRRKPTLCQSSPIWSCCWYVCCWNGYCHCG